jgi:NAD(P)-dependent dehydrogenase (short-subunit alcohol dehydrogenase family)
MTGRLGGKVALVTGGSRGIGRGIALHLAQEGCAIVAFTYHSDTASTESSAAAIEAAGAAAIAVRARLEQPEDIRQLFTTLDSELQRRNRSTELDILVNNAGSGGWDTLQSSVPETFDQIMAVHARAPFFVTQAAAGRLRNGGRVINMSSGWSTRPSKMAPVYSMAKAALNAMTQALAAELGERGITVNTVAPGWTATDGNAEVRKDAALVAQVEADTIFGRIADPADIAAVVSMFASAEAAWLTGQYVDANGGYRLG